MSKPMSGVPGPLTSPWFQSFEDYQGRAITITVTFNELTRLVLSVAVHRDAGCLFSKILIGTSADGIPDDTDKVVTVPIGDRSLTPQQLTNLAARGLGTIEDFDALQITAGR